MPMPATTRLLRTWLRYHPGKPILQADGTLRAEDLEKQLFLLTESAIGDILKRSAQRALGKRANPTLIRHSSATYWANTLSYFQMCKRFGWSMTSKMPQRYIDRAGVQEMEVAKIYYEGHATDQSLGSMRPEVNLTSKIGLRHS